MSNETPLVEGEICLGVEIEGKGTLKFTWNKAGEGMTR